MTKFLQGSTVIKTVLSGLTIQGLTANFLQCICVCQKLRKLAESEQSYCNDTKDAVFRSIL